MALRHLEAVQAGDAVGLVLGDLEVHLVGRHRGDAGEIQGRCRGDVVARTG